MKKLIVIIQLFVVLLWASSALADKPNGNGKGEPPTIEEATLVFNKAGMCDDTANVLSCIVIFGENLHEDQEADVRLSSSDNLIIQEYGDMGMSLIVENPLTPADIGSFLLNVKTESGNVNFEVATVAMGPQGVKGEQGIQGIQGEKGDMGAAGSGILRGKSGQPECDDTYARITGCVYQTSDATATFEDPGRDLAYAAAECDEPKDIAIGGRCSFLFDLDFEYRWPLFRAGIHDNPGVSATRPSSYRCAWDKPTDEEANVLATVYCIAAGNTD
jgi:hypothetical protein